MIDIRKGQAPAPAARGEFSARFRASFIDGAFRAEDAAISRLESIAWAAYIEGRKAPFTQKAGAGYADPAYELSSEWVATKARLEAAQVQWANPAAPSKVLLICGSARNGRHLSWRKLQNLSPDCAGARGAGGGPHRNRCAGPEPRNV